MYSLPQNVHLGGSVCTSRTFFDCGPKFTKSLSLNVEGVVVDQVFFRCSLCRSGDIRDKSRKLSKIPRFCMFLVPTFLGGAPPNFWTCFIKLNQFPIMWQSFTAIGRGTLENAWRKKKTARVKHKPVQNYRSGRPNKKNVRGH